MNVSKRAFGNTHACQQENIPDNPWPGPVRCVFARMRVCVGSRGHVLHVIFEYSRTNPMRIVGLNFVREKSDRKLLQLMLLGRTCT